MRQRPSQLMEGALVSLDLGRQAEPMLCRIVAFGGDDVVLAPMIPVDEDQHEVLHQGGEAFLLVEDGEILRALRCRTSRPTEEGDVRARIVDSFRLGQRRMFSRASLVLPAMITPLDDDGQPAGEAWRTFTRDMSAGGARLARQNGYVPAPLHAVVLDIPGGVDPVEAVLEVRRESDEDLGVCFLAISSEDRLRLEQAAISWQRARLMAAAEA